MVPGHMKGTPSFSCSHFVHVHEEVAKHEGILGKE